MTPADLLDRAKRAAESAELLLDSGDLNGACNRAYYAMFDAARAALIATQPPPASEAIKTHSGLISAFSLQLVKTGRVSVELGKSFSKVSDIRLRRNRHATCVREACAADPTSSPGPPHGITSVQTLQVGV